MRTTLRSTNCFYMIRIKIHSPIVHLADIPYFQENLLLLYWLLTQLKPRSHCGFNLTSECVCVSSPKCIDMKPYRFHLGWFPPILKQRTEANISSMLSATASPAMMRGRLLKNDFSWACHRLVLCYLFSQWITKTTFSHLPSVHYFVEQIIILIWKKAIMMITR